MSKFKKFCSIFAIVFSVLLSSMNIIAQNNIVQQEDETVFVSEEKDHDNELVESIEQIIPAESEEIIEAGESQIENLSESMNDSDEESENEITIVSDSSTAISRFDIYTNPVKTTYLSGEQVLFYAGVSLTEDSGTLSNTILEVKVPKKNIKNGTFEASSISSQISKTVTDEGDYYTVRYELAQLNSGSNIDIPIKFITENGSTPDGFIIPITAKFIGEDDKLLVESKTTEFEIKTHKQKVTKKLAGNNQSWTSFDGRKIIAGHEDPDKEGYLTNDLDKLYPVKFSFELRPTVSLSDYGKRKYETYVVKDTLPEGAVFIQEDNPGWTYNTETRVAEYVVKDQSNRALGQFDFTNIVNLNLKFPGQKLDEKLTNNIEVELTPLDKLESEEITITSDDISFTLDKYTKPLPPKDFSSGKGVSRTYYKDFQVDRDKTFTWNLSITNKARKDSHPDLKLSNIIITDDQLDSALKYTSINFNKNSAPVGTVDVSLIFENDVKEKIASSLDLSTSPSLDLQQYDDIKSIIVETVGDTYLEAEKRFLFEISTKLKNPNVPVLPELVNDRSLHNRGIFEGTYDQGVTYKVQNKPYIRFSKISPKLGISKTIQNKKQSYFINDELTFNLSVYAYDFGNKLVKGDVNQIVDILPAGLEYQENTAKLSVRTNDYLKTEYVNNQSFEPQIVHNYKGEGKTALVWDLKPFEVEGVTVHDSISDLYRISYTTKVTKMTREGLNKNIAYLSWNNNDLVKPYNNPIKDSFDLNNNNSVEDEITHSVADLNYVPPRELIIRKGVKGSLNDSYILPPSHGLSEIDTEMSYEFSLYNNSVVDIKTLHVLDLLPQVGDKTISEDISLTPPSRVERESSFALKLSKELVVPKGYKVLYTMDDTLGIENADDFYKNATWSESLSNYELATAFRLELIEGYILEKGKEVYFEVFFKVPNDTSLTDVDQAVNSFGVATTNNLDFFESNLSTVKIVSYQVDGHIFEDINMDNLHDLSDKVFKNHTVVLEDKDGNPVLDLEGNPMITTTDNEGYYKFDVYRAGEYRVKVQTPSKFDKVLNSLPNIKGGSHLLSNKVDHTDSFKLNHLNPKETRNSGYFRVLTDVKVEKVWVNGPSIKPSIELQLYRNGEAHLEAIVLENTSEYTWENLEFKDDSGNIYTYTVDEINVPENYEKTIDVNVITNTYVIPKGEYSVEKVWIDGPLVKPTIDLQLYRNDEAYGDVVSLKDSETVYTWTDLDLTDEFGNVYTYTVDELSELEDYTKTVSDNVITNTYVISKGEYTAEKIWINGPTVKPTIELQLYQNGQAYLEAITLKNTETEYTWKDLDLTDRQGNPYVYTVDEVSVPENFSKTVKDNVITNTYVTPKGEYTVEKVWINAPAIKPTIELQLYRNGEVYEQAISLKDSETTYTWKDLDLTDELGIPYVYTVDELTESSDFEKTVDGNVITNTYPKLETEVPEEPKVPEKPVSKVPGTGIGSKQGLFITVLILSLLTLVLTILKRRKLNIKAK